MLYIHIGVGLTCFNSKHNLLQRAVCYFNNDNKMSKTDFYKLHIVPSKVWLTFYYDF